MRKFLAAARGQEEGLRPEEDRGGGAAILEPEIACPILGCLAAMLACSHVIPDAKVCLCDAFSCEFGGA